MDSVVSELKQRLIAHVERIKSGDGNDNDIFPALLWFLLDGDTKLQILIKQKMDSAVSDLKQIAGSLEARTAQVLQEFIQSSATKNEQIRNDINQASVQQIEQIAIVVSDLKQIAASLEERTAQALQDFTELSATKIEQIRNHIHQASAQQTEQIAHGFNEFNKSYAEAIEMIKSILNVNFKSLKEISETRMSQIQEGLKEASTRQTERIDKGFSELGNNYSDVIETTKSNSKIHFESLQAGLQAKLKWVLLLSGVQLAAIIGLGIWLFIR
jgi:hypothetical protein